jgi:hypothetical protein
LRPIGVGPKGFCMASSPTLNRWVGLLPANSAKRGFWTRRVLSHISPAVDGVLSTNCPSRRRADRSPRAPGATAALHGGCRTNHSGIRSINCPWDATVNSARETPDWWDSAPARPTIRLAFSHHSPSWPISPLCATASRGSGTRCSFRVIGRAPGRKVAPLSVWGRDEASVLLLEES